MSQLQRNTYNNTINITIAILSRLSGGNIVGLLSSVLTEYEQLSMTKYGAIVTNINKYISNEPDQSLHWKALQFIAPHF